MSKKRNALYYILGFILSCLLPVGTPHLVEKIKSGQQLSYSESMIISMQFALLIMILLSAFNIIN